MILLQFKLTPFLEPFCSVPLGVPLMSGLSFPEVLVQAGDFHELLSESLLLAAATGSHLLVCPSKLEVCLKIRFRSIEGH